MSGNASVARRKGLAFADDLCSAITHGLGVAMALTYFGILLGKSLFAHSPRSVVAYSIYGGCLIFTYLSSTLYHSLPYGRAKRVFRLFDHCSIFFCIAGAYTPVIMFSYGSLKMALLLSLIWTLAAAGLALKICSFCLADLDRTERPSIILYVCMGWLALAMLPTLVHTLPLGALLFIAGGGVLYTIGLIFYSLDGKMPLNHTFWHLFILAASTLQFVAFLIWL